MLFHFDWTRAVLSRNRESSASVIGCRSSKSRVEWRSRSSFANGEMVSEGAAESLRRSIFLPGQRGRTAGGGGIMSAYG